jgi:hypothetical protein
MTLFYINLGSEFYEDLNDYKNFLRENESNCNSKSSDFFISALLLRLWRRNFKLNFLPVEFLDFLIMNYKSELISDTVKLLFYINCVFIFILFFILISFLFLFLFYSYSYS